MVEVRLNVCKNKEQSRERGGNSPFWYNTVWYKIFGN